MSPRCACATLTAIGGAPPRPPPDFPQPASAIADAVAMNIARSMGPMVLLFIRSDAAGPEALGAGILGLPPYRLPPSRTHPNYRRGPRNDSRGCCAYGLGAMAAKLDVGRTYQSQTRVEEWMTAEKAGNKGVDVLSTPMLLQLVEDAAMQCIAPTMGAGQVSLGTHIDLAHLAPTPVGLLFWTEVEV